MRALLLTIAVLLIGAFSAWADDTRIYDSSQFNCNNINVVAQDSTGYIWVGTDYGLNRFDGVRFVRYNHTDGEPTSLLNNVVQTLLSDREGRLWVGTNNGLQLYNPATDDFTTIDTGEAISVEGIVHLQSGQIWFITPGGGVREVDAATGSASAVEWLNDMYRETHFSDIFQDSQGRVWLGSSRGLVCVDAERQKNLSTGNLILNEYISDIDQSPEGEVYVSTSTRLLRLDETDPRNPHFEQILHSGIINFVGMYIAPDGTIYLGTNGDGLKYIEPGTRLLKSMTGLSLPAHVEQRSMCNMIMEDRLHNLWISYIHLGVVKYSREETYFNHHALQEDQFRRITAMGSTDNDILCGFVSTPALVRFDKNSFTREEIPVPRGVRAIFADDEGTYWLGSYYGGLYRWRAGQRTVTRVPAVPFVWIYAIADDEHGNLYLSDFGNGMKRYTPQTGEVQTLEHHPESDGQAPGLTNNWVNVLVRDSRGGLWIGHHNGVNLYDTHSGQFVALPFDDVLSTEICQTLLEDRRGNIWIGTKNALYKYTRGERTLKRLTIADGLSNDVICNLQQDAEGNIWCSTLNGINQISEDGETIVCYYAGNGLQDNTYYAVGHTGESGQIYFGGHKGITDFDPANITLTHFSGSVSIANMYVNGERVSASDDLLLRHFENTVAFDLSTMDFRPPENIYYEYRIPEFDNHWNATSPGDHEIVYHNLPPGGYTLQVVARENNAKSATKEVQIAIAPPWYQTVWAKVIYLLVAGGIVWQFFYMLKRRRREEINEAKLQFFINIAHEIRSPMTLVVSPLEALLKREHNPDTQKALVGIHRNAGRIVRLMNQLLDIRKIDKGQMNLVFSEVDLIPFVDEQIEYLREQAAKRNIALSFEHPDEELKVWLDPQNFDKVIINLLDNALKYTPEGGEVTVRTTLRQQSVSIEVLDTGEGIEPAEQKKIFERFYQTRKSSTDRRLPGFGIGLNLCRLLVHLHHGTIEVKNRTERSGSNFIVSLPLGNHHLHGKTLGTRKPFISEEKGSYAECKECPDEKHRKRTNFSLLIVDDDQEIRDYLAEELAKTYRIYTAPNGKEGVKMALKHRPDVIISDVIMPDMDGFELLKTLKNNYETSHIPIVLLTSKTEHADRIAAFERGADNYLPKPFNIDELDAIVTNLCNSRQRLKGIFAGKHPQDNTTALPDVQDKDAELMRKITKVVDEHIGDQELTVDIIAHEVGISRAQLHRRLKEIAGISAGKLIQNMRLTKAAQLLKEKSVNISQLAYAVGYTTPSNFSTAFKNYFGISPKEYVEQLEKSSPVPPADTP
jgi:signal transduction histidine kinase/ligand-binding sensor domain-containing protein/DNA-binding response OmpR family regulator